MKTGKITLLVIVSFIALNAFRSPCALAQPAVDRATKEVDRKVRERAAEELRPRPKKPEIIKEEEKVPEEKGPEFFVKKINLEGCRCVSPDAFRHLVEKYENKKVSLKDLDDLAKEIQREYLRMMIIATCYVPLQEVKDGIVTIKVIEAKMGELHVSEGRYFNKDMLDFYWTTKPGETLKYDKMRRNMLRMNENPDHNVTANLKAGKAPGTTDVYLDAKTRFPLHPLFSYDREGVRSTGIGRTGFGARHNNFLFVDDTFLAGYTFGKDFDGFYAYHSVPVTNIGTRVMYGLNGSKANPKKEFTRYVIKSEVLNSSIFVQQDIYYKADYLGEFSFGLDAKDKTTTYTSGTLNRDRLRILRMQLFLISRALGGITYITPEFSQGVNGLGARRKSEFSSRGAENTFSRFNLSLRHKRPLPFGLAANLNFKCQFPSEKLPPQEQYFLGGIDSVRGYPSGDFLADNAVQANVELLVPAFFIPETVKLPFDEKPLKQRLTGLVFFDYGYGNRRGATGTEKSKVNFAGIGPGLRIRLYDKAILRLEWGFPVADDPITETADSRFHFSINFEL